MQFLDDTDSDTDGYLLTDLTASCHSAMDSHGVIRKVVTLIVASLSEITGMNLHSLCTKQRNSLFFVTNRDFQLVHIPFDKLNRDFLFPW